MAAPNTSLEGIEPMGQCLPLCAKSPSLRQALDGDGHNVRARHASPFPHRHAPFGGPEDWSSRHIIYTGNGSVEDMLKPATILAS